MTTEVFPRALVDTVERRARVFAAIGDPGRLRVLDALILGDASPGELGSQLGLTSNLLAHHLGVLEREGLVIRHRSQADRRRSYLRLVPGGLDGLLPGLGVTTGSTADQSRVTRVVFVCTANSARSQLAAALSAAHSSPVPVTSGGTDPAPAIADGAVAVARRHGLPLTRATPRQLPDLKEEDYLVTVCDNAYENLNDDAAFAIPKHRLHWSVPDPVPVGSKQAFEDAYADLEGRVITLVRHLTHQTNGDLSPAPA